MAVMAVMVAGVAYLRYWIPFVSLSEDEVIRRYDRSLITVSSEDPVEKRGEYLVNVTPCHLCHTQQTWWGPKRTLVGGAAMSSAWFGTVHSFNLTSSRTNGVGKETMATLLRSLRTGLDESGKVVERRAMPWDLFSHLSQPDVEAILGYLRQIPAQDVFEGAAYPPRPADPGWLGLSYEDRR